MLLEQVKLRIQDLILELEIEQAQACCQHHEEMTQLQALEPCISLSLIDEDEEMTYWGNGEDEEGYNNDNDHYVDVDDE